MAGGSTFTWQHALLLHSNKSPFDSPVPETHKAFADVEPISWERRNVAGILVTIYGLRELPSPILSASSSSSSSSSSSAAAASAAAASDVACLWLLHGRGDTQDSMGFCASALITAWNHHRRSLDPDSPAAKRGLIAVSFDQRNHGSRMVENSHNLSWKQGNLTHGIDMFGAYVGSARDLSLLIRQLPGYLPFRIARNICGGVSLGGHATWVALMGEPKVEAGLVVVGCADYVRLMRDRATRGERRSTLGEGSEFVGSEDFPPSLVEAVKEFDPAGILTGVATEEDLRSGPSDADVARLRTLLERTLKGKKILCLSGKKDKLVPYAQSVPFLTWLKKGIDKTNGWAGDMSIELEDIIDPEGRHEFSALMRKEAERWLCGILSDNGPNTRQGSKI